MQWLEKFNAGTFRFHIPSNTQIINWVNSLIESSNYQAFYTFGNGDHVNELFTNGYDMNTDVQNCYNNHSLQVDYYNTNTKKMFMKCPSGTVLLSFTIDGINYAERSLSVTSSYCNYGLSCLYDEESQKAYFISIQYYVYSNVTYVNMAKAVSQIDGYNLFNWLNGTLPIEYNYTPIDYIHNPSKTLKLSMIKAESTNHGESNMSGSNSDIQRLTDETNLYLIAKNMSDNSEQIIGYTAENNYVVLKRLSSEPQPTGGTAIYTKLEYYTGGTRITSLDTVLPKMYHSSLEAFQYFYLTLLVDTEHEACRSSILQYARVLDTDMRNYNYIENDLNIVTDANQRLWWHWLGTGWYSGEVDNPYQYGGESGEETGGGTWDNTSDNIDIPSEPSLNISDTDFITVFNPTLGQVKSLAEYMWSGLFSETGFKKLFANPMDCILGFSIVPCTPSISGVGEVVVGNISTNVSMNLVSNQYVTVDCGSIQIKPFWNNYLDYAPYTKIQLVLPFIGTVNLNVDDVMGKTVSIKYRIDILSGGCIAFVTCDGNLMYQFSGSCVSQLPLSNSDYRNMVSSLISIGTTAVGLGSAIASGGITAPMVAVGVGNTANNVMNSKPTIEHGGSLASASGFLACRTPYIIITRARQCVPKDVEKYKGFPSLITSKLKNMTGFTSVTTIHLDGVPCSQEELTELDELLKGGVII